MSNNVTVIICLLQCRSLFRRDIVSTFNQKFKEFDILIIDDWVLNTKIQDSFAHISL